jgi:hypothetical protein
MNTNAYSIDSTLPMRAGCCCCLAIFLIAKLACGSPKTLGDHLLPVDESAFRSQYRTIVNKQLLVTPGDLARCVWLPGNVGTEGTVSLYKSTRKNSSAKSEYKMTVTQASKPLWEELNKGITHSRVAVTRFDLSVPEGMALAISDLWRAMLVRVSDSPHDNSTSLDSSTEVFSATVAGHETIGRLDKNPTNRNSLELLDIANSLLEYFNYPASERPQRAKQIQQRASSLKERVEATTNESARR